MGSQKVGHDLVSEQLNGNIKILHKIPTQRSLKLEYKFIPMVNFWSCSAIAEGALRVWMEPGPPPGPSLVGRGVDPSAPYKGCWEHQVFHETQLNILRANVLNPTDEWRIICKLRKSPALRADVWARVYSPRLCRWCCKDQERNSSKGGKEDVDQENHFYSAKMLVRQWKTGVWGPLKLNRVKSPPPFTTVQVPYKG